MRFFIGPQPMETYVNPPELGGLRSNFPLAHPVNRQMAREMWTDWRQTIGLAENACWPSYSGDVYSVQLTARPGYYVSPDLLYELGWDEDEGAPNA